MTLVTYLIDSVKIAAVLGVTMGAVAYTTFGERRFASFFQNRVGPNRAGPWGLLQPLADGIKFMFKEDFVPKYTDRFLFRIAPLIAFVPALMLVGVIPFGPDLVIGERVIQFQIADPNFGVLYFFAVASFGVYGVIIAGWGSNNKYAVMGGMRAAAMMIGHIGFPDRQKRLEAALDICGNYECKLKMTGRDTGSTGRDYAEYLMETMKDPNVEQRLKDYQAAKAGA